MLAIVMPSGLAALGAGTVLALAGAAFVLGPLLREDGAVVPPPPVEREPKRAGDAASAVDALREIEFDRATGKLSDDDYGALKATYTQAALAELRAKDAATSTAAVVDDEAVERAIRAFRRAPGAMRACVVCGPRPESDAEFCSNCGRYLAAACAHCGAACPHEAQRYCGQCGDVLASAA